MRKSVASFSAFLIAGALLAACSSGSGGGSNAQDTLPPVTDAVSSTAGLAQLVAHAAEQSYKITFTDQSGVMQTYAQDGKGHSAQFTPDSETFTTARGTVNCDKNGTAFVCTKSPPSVTADSGNPLLGVVTLEQTQLSELGGNFGNRSNRTIAGRGALCITFAPKDLVGDSTETVPPALLASKASYSYCLDTRTGVTLEVSGTDDAGKHTTSFEVTKFETPTVSDFVPPATPT